METPPSSLHAHVRAVITDLRRQGVWVTNDVVFDTLAREWPWLLTPADAGTEIWKRRVLVYQAIANVLTDERTVPRQ
jgi:hypothetical protein